MKINIIDLVGKIIELKVRSNDTIERIKYKIQDKTGVPQNQQKLIFAGKLLHDKQRLKDMYIFEDTTLHLIYSLRGD